MVRVDLMGLGFEINLAYFLLSDLLLDREFLETQS